MSLPCFQSTVYYDLEWESYLPQIRVGDFPCLIVREYFGSRPEFLLSCESRSEVNLCVDVVRYMRRLRPKWVGHQNLL